MESGSIRQNRFPPSSTPAQQLGFSCSHPFQGSVDFINFRVDLLPSNSLLVCDPQLHLAIEGFPTLYLKSCEDNKTLSGLETIIKFLQNHQADRGSTLVAIGGGSLLDLVGFAASIYMRGITWWAIPTTLLSMVDASVGGKTGVNFHNVKNLIGSFYPAEKTVIDPGFLATLPAPQYAAGFAEIIKMAWVADADGWEKVFSQDISQLIAYAIKLKLKTIDNDWFETKANTGRILLNAGHTFGHAFERLYPDLSHGQAVALGLIAEHEFAEAYTQSCHSTPMLRQALEQAGLMTNFKSYLTASEQHIALINKDKKTYGNVIQLVVAKAPGQSYCLKCSADDIRTFVSGLSS